MHTGYRSTGLRGILIRTGVAGMGDQEGTLEDRTFCFLPKHKSKSKKSMACLSIRKPFSEECPSPSLDPRYIFMAPSSSDLPQLGAMLFPLPRTLVIPSVHSCPVHRAFIHLTHHISMLPHVYLAAFISITAATHTVAALLHYLSPSSGLPLWAATD